MIELVFVACLMVDTQHCEQRSLLFQDIGIMTCMMQGQAQLAQWSNGHPNWQIQSWKCRPHDRSIAEI
ncbi:hypothetical protein KUV62_19990 [Salipiger bermudensis]|uniref:hypothetical protein n=1 Tax=Salipiger bermudensis TaxID=344736 RepID=UPI001C994A39|nr:hypothetical protein [Salipiger bermudensis]MBY6006215.1 hypothetical protein [Salipiger bermudensis]